MSMSAEAVAFLRDLYRSPVHLLNLAELALAKGQYEAALALLDEVERVLDATA